MSQKQKKDFDQENDQKTKFREALEKKKSSKGVRNNNTKSNTKISGGRTSINSTKIFRRKSGSD